MPTKLITSTSAERDGTSQPGRASGALSPEYVSVDERTAEDLLSFVRDYAKTLVYFEDDDRPGGDFSAFLGSLSPADVAAFMKEPERFDQDQFRALFRPHFTLFLAFLRLFQGAQAELNGITRRHLTFHYRRFLRMEPRGAAPDRVNLLFSISERESRALVPAGTLVHAGTDAIGKDILYRTQDDLVVNRAVIEKMSSVFVERRLVGIEQSWHSHRNDPEDGRFEMLRIAFGRPLPGDPLPDYPGDPPTPLDTNDALDAKLDALKGLVQFAKQGLHLSVAELRSLMALAEPTADASAANGEAKYRAIIDAIWKERNGLAERQTQPGEAALSPDAYADAVLGDLVVPGLDDVKTLRGYWNALREVERYFGMPIEVFEVLVDKILVEGPAWDAGYENDAVFVARVLEQAHHEKVRNERVAALKVLRESLPLTEGYAAILQSALFDGIDPALEGTPDDELEDNLRTYLTEDDVSKLRAARASAKWDDVYGLLAHAMATRLGRNPPRKAAWLNLFPAEDARAVVATRATPDPEGNLPFSTFGAPRPSDAEAPPAAVLGFAITSPLLALESGTRTISLTLGLHASGVDFDRLKAAFAKGYGKVDPFGRNLSPFAVEVSTEEGWRRLVPNVEASGFGVYDEQIGGAAKSTWRDHEGAPGLKLVFTLVEGDPPIAPLPSMPDGMDARWPALRILMQPVWSATEDRYVTHYREIGSLFVGALHVMVTAAGLAPSALENDESVLEPNKPFEPFGSAPVVGSRLSIGHPEIVAKKIDRVALSFQWMGAPADLKAHYKNYPITSGGATPVFTSKLRWVDVSGPKTISESGHLFAGSTADVTAISGRIDAPLPADHASAARGAVRVSSWRRYLQWELSSPDFQHRAFPAVAAQKGLDLALALANPSTNKSTLKTSDYQVNPPYTPKLSFLKLEYESAIEILLHRPSAKDRLDRAYHVYPFGVAELSTGRISDKVPFLPRDYAGSELCIGLAGVSLPETVTLLFQLDEASADRDVEPPVVTWSQLSGNRWVPLGRDVLSDSTRGLQTSGIVELALGRAEPSTLLPASLTWVRASIEQDHASICDTRAAHTQAVAAIFDDRGNAPEHYRAPLPGGSVTKLETPIEGIAGVAQPYPSRGGRPAEDERTFTTRVSERLRHKQRALSSWDYERIVLDAFPQIFKAKCIPVSEDEPGRVEVLVLPDVRALATNELRPKAPVELLSAVEEHLAARTPSCASVNVRNATFRAVRLRLGVRFSESGNDAYWVGRLNEELNRFLSPWAYEEGADIAIGGRIYASNIIDFVDRRPYVDYLAGVALFYTDDEGQRFTFLRPPGGEGGAYYVEAGGPDRVLAAYASHQIDVVTTEHYDAQLYRGISHMEIEMDFVVG